MELSRKLGKTYMILIKPHPMEKLEEYRNIENNNIKLLDLEELAWVPVELIINYLDFRTVITSFSSAAFNIYKNREQIQVIYLYNILHGLKFDTTVMKPIISETNIYCPVNLNEVIEIIQKEDDIDCKGNRIVNTDEDINFLASLLGDEKNG